MKHSEHVLQWSIVRRMSNYPIIQKSECRFNLHPLDALVAEPHIISVDITSAVNEVIQKKPDIKWKEAACSGMNVGRAAMGTMTTL